MVNAYSDTPRIILPAAIPAAAILRGEGVTVDERPGEGERPLRILLLNLMPEKTITELDIARMMLRTGRCVQLIPVCIPGQTYKTTPREHIEAFYRPFTALSADSFDGLIVTGAPVEHLPFADVRYWSELCDIMDWAVVNVKMRLFICWGAQAALYHRYGVPKHSLSDKCFGIYSQQVCDAAAPMMRALPSVFPMPTSRHTEVRSDDMVALPLNILAQSRECGPTVITSADGREVYVTGHMEYGVDTLDREYRRDLSRGLPIHVPEHYYAGDTPSGVIPFTWREAAQTLYHNWLDEAARLG